jgi:hypothetical protein
VNLPANKLQLLELLYEASTTLPHEKAAAYERFYVAVDAARAFWESMWRLVPPS